MTSQDFQSRLHRARRSRLSRAEREAFVLECIGMGEAGIRHVLLTPPLADVAPELLASHAATGSIAAAEGPLLDPDTPFTIRRHIARILIQIVRASRDANAPEMAQVVADAVALARSDWNPPNLHHARLGASMVTMIRAAAGEIPEPNIARLLASSDEEETVKGLSLAPLSDDASHVVQVLQLTESPELKVRLAARWAVQLIQRDDTELPGMLRRAIAGGALAAIETLSEMARSSDCEGCIPVLLEGLDTATPVVRRIVARALRSWRARSEDIERWVLAALDEGCARRKRHALTILNPGASQGCVEAVLRAADDTDASVRCAALMLIRRLEAPLEAAVRIVEQAAADPAPKVRLAAAEAIRDGVGVHSSGRRRLLRQLAVDRVGDIAAAGIGGLLRLESSSDIRFAVRRIPALPQNHRGPLLREVRRECLPMSALCAMLRRADPQIVLWAYDQLERRVGTNKARRLAVDQLGRARGPGARELLDAIDGPGRRLAGRRASELLNAQGQDVRELATRETLKRKPETVDAAWMLARLDDPSPIVRYAIFGDRFSRFEQDDRDAVLSKALADPDCRVATAALQSLRADESARHAGAIAGLLAIEKLPVGFIRACIEHLFRALPDPRARGALISLAATDEEGVSVAARATLRRFTKSSTAKIGWGETVERIRTVRRWGERTGRALTGQRVRIVPLRNGLGRTIERMPGHRELLMWISDAPIASGAPHGEDIVRGLIVHELGHHVWDIGQPGHRRCREIARREGCGHHYDILIDERLERHMRSLDPAFGRYLDRLASYAFARSTARAPLERYAEALGLTSDEAAAAIKAGATPGRIDPRTASGEAVVELSLIDLLRTPALSSPVDAWMACLRGGHDPAIFASEQVREALSRAPADLRHATHREVLDVARRVAVALGDDRRWARQRRKLEKLLRRDLEALHDQLLRLDAHRTLAKRPAPIPPSGRAEARGVDLRRLRRRQAARRRRARLPECVELYNDGSNVTFDPLEVRDCSDQAVDPTVRDKMLSSIRPFVHTLRAHMERIGFVEAADPMQRRGRRLDLAVAPRAGVVARPDILVHRREEQAADLYMGIIIDRSGSMQGEKLKTAKHFGLLLAEACRGIRGIEGHVCAFDASRFDILGDFRRHAIPALRVAGGNNDAGALARAVELACASRRSRRILVMISDGLPTGCTLAALRRQVELATRQHRVICAQAAVSPLPAIAFPHYVDLSALSLDDAIDRFGRLLVELSTQGVPGRRSMSPSRWDEARRRESGGGSIAPPRRRSNAVREELPF